MTTNAWSWTASDLQRWNACIQEEAYRCGLTPFDVDFRILDWDQLMNFMAYGITFHYRHWSFGKEYDITRKAKRMEAEGLPYEVVVNTNPAVAILWRDNNLVLQILVMAHVYGHTDFFANNLWFQKYTRADRIEDTCRAHAQVVAELMRDPSIPRDGVENLLTAAHALRFHRPRLLNYKRETREQQQERCIRRFREDHQEGEWDHLKPKKERRVPMPDFNQVPLEPDEDLLRFLAEYAPLEDWERQILQIVASESDRLIPNASTKVMNEGWATYWHNEIVHALFPKLPVGFPIEYARTMSGVTCPRAFGLNPYWLGLAIWRDIYRRYETPDRSDPLEKDLPGGEGKKMLFHIRQTDSDATFIGSYLSDRLISELRLFSFIYEGDHLDEEVYRITDVPDREGYERIRQKVIANIGMNRQPVIHVVNANLHGDHTLKLEHVHDGRDLKLFKPDAPLRSLTKSEIQCGDIQFVMKHIARIWRNPICLRTRYDGVDMLITCSRDGDVDINKA